jgi:hypothetical protein
MTLQLLGARRLADLMRAERTRDLDTSWLLFGPEPDVEDEVEAEEPQPWRYAAE